MSYVEFLSARQRRIDLRPVFEPLNRMGMRVSQIPSVRRPGRLLLLLVLVCLLYIPSSTQGNGDGTLQYAFIMVSGGPTFLEVISDLFAPFRRCMGPSGSKCLGGLDYW